MMTIEMGFEHRQSDKRHVPIPFPTILSPSVSSLTREPELCRFGVDYWNSELLVMIAAYSSTCHGVIRSSPL